MANILSKLANLLVSVIKRVFSALWKIFRKLFWVIVFCALAVYAPEILVFLQTAGAPGWVISAFSGFASFTTPLASALSWLGGTAATLGSSALSAFSTAQIGTQAMVLAGSAALISPEETADVVGEVAKSVGTVGGAVLAGAGTVAAGLLGGMDWLVWLGAGFVVYKVLTSERGASVQTVRQSESPARLQSSKTDNLQEDDRWLSSAQS